jgi:hypothetical protein
MVDALHINTWNRMLKPFASALIMADKGLGGDSGGNLTNVQCKVIGHWHNEALPTMNIC